MPSFHDEASKVLSQEKELIFYRIMKYPVPKESDYFLFSEKEKAQQPHIERIGEFTKSPGFSWKEKNPYMDEYVNFIQKYSRLYRSIPFVHSIYVCNSLTFNALDEHSDIDLFIVAKKGALWRARLSTELYFRLFGLKRGFRRHIRKKFCLSFYVTQDHQNLYNIMLPQNDIYFIYRLAHLVPLYQEEYENIYKQNKWIQSVLPGFPGKNIINIGIETLYGANRWKKFREFWSGGLGGKLIEISIKAIRIPIVIYKKNRLGKLGRGIVINNHMLKFHADIREKVHLMYELYLKRYKEKKLMQP